MKEHAWTFILTLGGFVLGIAMGLLIAWVAAPIEYVNTGPASLKPEFKDQYRMAIAYAYNATHNMERAQARLALLDDADSQRTLIEQSQRMLADGRFPDAAFELALFVNALQAQPAPSESETQTQAKPAITTEPSALPTSSISFATTPQRTPTPGPSSTPLPTATVRATSTPSPTPGQPFELVEREEVCNPDAQPGLLAIEVRDANRRPIPGAQVIISWDQQEENIYTGLKPEINNGYADFLMQNEAVYSARLAAGGETANLLSPAACPSEDGKSSYPGGIKLIFQQP